MRFAGICQYDGCNYSGFQSQKNAISVQDKLELAISSIGHLNGRINYAGRTDAGVHATHQVFDFSTSDDRAIDQWFNGINSLLPVDIAVSCIKEAPENFHSRFDAIDRTYSYVIYTGKTRPTFQRNYVYWEKNEIDLKIMKKQASYLMGTHNFSSFRGSKCNASNPVRTVKSIEIIKKNNFVIIHLCANAYLYNMVRIIVGTLLDIAKGSNKDIKSILTSEDRRNAGKTVQSNGLFLTGASYEKINFNQEENFSNPLIFFPA